MLRSLPVSLSVAGGIGGDDIGVCTVEGVGGNTVGDEVVGEGKTGCVGNCAFGEAGKKVPSGATEIFVDDVAFAISASGDGGPGGCP